MHTQKIKIHFVLRHFFHVTILFQSNVTYSSPTIFLFINFVELNVFLSFSDVCSRYLLIFKFIHCLSMEHKLLLIFCMKTFFRIFPLLISFEHSFCIFTCSKSLITVCAWNNLWAFVFPIFEIFEKKNRVHTASRNMFREDFTLANTRNELLCYSK